MTIARTADLRRPGGLALIGVATGIAGVAGYLITWLVPREIGFGEYVTFAVYWSFLFLVVSALSGIQQEVTRSTRPMVGAGRDNSVSAGRFGAVASVVVMGLALASAPFWVDVVFPREGWGLVWPLAVGISSYVLMATLYGSLYGTFRWQPLFWVIVAEAVLRLAAIGWLLAIDAGIVAMAWAVALPYAATLAIVWPLVRRSPVRPVLDVAYTRLAWNICRTVLAATSMGVLVSGFPLILGLTSGGDPAELVALLILAATLTRAPLIVVAMAFQSYLIVQFRSAGPNFWKLFSQLQLFVLTCAAPLGLMAWWIGPSVFGWLFPGEPVPANWVVVVLVVSSALVGMLCISAPAVLAMSGHGNYTLGWVLAAVTTIVCLMVPSDLYSRVVWALNLGPIVGLLVHVSYLFKARLKVADPKVL